MLSQMEDFLFFLRLNNIPSYLYRGHIFVHSSVDGRLGYFNILAIVGSASVNPGMQISL